MKKCLIGLLMVCILIFGSLPLSANAETTRENIIQTLDTTEYGSYIKVYLNKTDSMYNPINTMAIVNTGKLAVKFNYKVTEDGKGPLRVELRGYTSDAVKEAANPYWDGWQYDASSQKLSANTEYSFDAVLDTKSLSDGKKVQDGPYLFFGGAGTTLQITDLEIYAEGSYEEPIYALNSMNLQETSSVELLGYDAPIYELADSRWDIPRTQHRIATYKNVYDFVEGTDYSVVFWYKTGKNGKTFNLDTCSDLSEATGWKNIGNYQLTGGTDTWQKGVLAFTCSSALAENDRLYLSYNLADSSNDPETDYLYITDMILYKVPENEISCVNASMNENAIGGPEFTYEFNGSVDNVSFLNEFKLNGTTLEKNEYEFLPDTTAEVIHFKITKPLPPLSEVKAYIPSCYDKYGRMIEFPDNMSHVFTVNPYISSEVAYYDISDEAFDEKTAPITSLDGASKVKAEFILKNNTAETKTCYIVNMVLSGGIVKTVCSPIKVIIDSGVTTEPVYCDIQISKGDVIRSFYWSSTDKSLRAYNMYSEFK